MDTSFIMQKICTKFLWDHFQSNISMHHYGCIALFEASILQKGRFRASGPPVGAPNAGGVGKIAFFWPIKKLLAQMPCDQKFVSTCHHSPHPRWCSGAGMCGVINNFGDCHSLSITVSTVWKSVDNMHGITCSLCDS